MIALRTVTNRGIRCVIGGMLAAVLWGASIGMAAAAPPAPVNAPPPPKADETATRYWTSQWRFDDIDIDAFASRLRTIGIDLGWQIRGNVTVRLEVGVPITSLGDPAAYRFEGTIRSPRLAVSSHDSAALTFEDFQSALTYRDGRARLEQLSFSMVDSDGTRIAPSGPEQKGKVNGQASMQLIGQPGEKNERGNFQFSLDGDDISLQEVIGWVGSVSGRAAPVVDGKLDFRIRGSGRLAEPTVDSAWNMTGSLASPSLRLAGWDLGVLEHDLTASATHFELCPRRDEDSLPVSIKIGKVTSSYQVSRNALEIESLTANVFGGTVRGNATLPRDGKSDLIATLTVDGVRPSYRNASSGRLGTELSATFTGDVDWRVPIALWSDPNEHHGTGKLSVTEMLIGKPLDGELHGKLAAEQGRVEFQVGGKVWGGTVAVETAANAESSHQWSELIRRLEPTTLRFEGMSFEAVMDWWTGDAAGISGRVGGEASVDLASWRPADQVFPDTSLGWELSRISHRRRTLSRQMRFRGRVERDVLAIESLVGDYAGGTVRGSGRVYLFDGQGVFHPRTDLRLAGSRIPLNPGLAFLGDAVDQTRGRVSVTTTLAGYRESLRLRGSWEGRGLAVFDVPIGSAHGGLAANVNLRTLGWDVRFPAIRSRVGGGQLEGELKLASGRRGGVDLLSQWKTRRVDFFRLVHQLGGSHSLARGEISGELSLEGKSIRELDDLAGRFNFQLEQTRGAAIPGLAAASQFLGPVSLASQSFDTGRARGVIGQGVVAVDEFWLGSDAALVQADGKVFLRSGRMDLKAIIATGDYRDIATNFAELVQRYALRSFLPTSAVLSVSELLRDRTLVVSIRGTTGDPIVRLRPIETFREETARFLLREGERLILAGITAEVTD